VTTRPLESLALLVAELQRRVNHWRRRYRHAIGALQEKTIECDNYRKEAEQKSRTINELTIAGTEYSCRRKLSEMAVALGCLVEESSSFSFAPDSPMASAVRRAESLLLRVERAGESSESPEPQPDLDGADGRDGGGL
jgi:hypothetical protein